MLSRAHPYGHIGYFAYAHINVGVPTHHVILMVMPMSSHHTSSSQGMNSEDEPSSSHANEGITVNHAPAQRFSSRTTVNNPSTQPFSPNIKVGVTVNYTPVLGWHLVQINEVRQQGTQVCQVFLHLAAIQSFPLGCLHAWSGGTTHGH
jgi:hypothetical protein